MSLIKSVIKGFVLLIVGKDDELDELLEQYIKSFECDEESKTQNARGQINFERIYDEWKKYKIANIPMEVTRSIESGIKEVCDVNSIKFNNGCQIIMLDGQHKCIKLLFLDESSTEYKLRGYVATYKGQPYTMDFTLYSTIQFDSLIDMVQYVSNKVLESKSQIISDYQYLYENNHYSYHIIKDWIIAIDKLEKDGDQIKQSELVSEFNEMVLNDHINPLLKLCEDSRKECDRIIEEQIEKEKQERIAKEKVQLEALKAESNRVKSGFGDYNDMWVKGLDVIHSDSHRIFNVTAPKYSEHDLYKKGKIEGSCAWLNGLGITDIMPLLDYPELRTVWIHDNKISEIPLEFLEKTNIETMWIGCNPLAKKELIKMSRSNISFCTDDGWIGGW